MREEFYNRHWLCVGAVTAAARKLIRASGGDCTDLPESFERPALVLVWLPVDKSAVGLVFLSKSDRQEIAIDDQARITLYARLVSPPFYEWSIDHLFIATSEEWQELQRTLPSQLLTI
jgi:hypothetical protein